MNTNNPMNSSSLSGPRKRFASYQQMMHPAGTLLFPGALLQRAATLYPDRPAISFKGVKKTFKEVFAQARCITHHVRTHQVGRSDRVCLLMENSEYYHASYYGIWQTGAVVVPLNTFLTDAELVHIMQDAQPKVVVVSQEFSPRIEQLFGSSSFARVVVTPNLFEQPEPLEPLDIPSSDPQEMSVVLYTSGTTGFPKGVMLSSLNIMTNIAQILSTVEADYKDSLFGVLPLFHSFAQNVAVWTSVFMGAMTIIIPKIERSGIMQGLQEKPTIVMGVPAFYGLLCLMKHIDLSRVRFLISGGDALPDKIRAAVQLVYRRKLLNGYGLTETSPFIAADCHDVLHDTNTVGMPAPGIEVEIRDEHNNRMPHGDIGILWVKGANVMLGYYNAPDATREVLVDGWLNTGDFAYLDPEGNIVIAGRHKDLIIHKGFNIYPQEIENVLLLHPAVFKAAVIGQPDEATGEVPIAFVAMRSEVAGLEQELHSLCVRHLAAYKVPRRFICLSDLPMTPLAKINKKILRTELAQGKYG